MSDRRRFGLLAGGPGLADLDDVSWPALLVALPLVPGALVGLACSGTPFPPLAILASAAWALGLMAWRRGKDRSTIVASAACLFSVGVGLGAQAEHDARRPSLAALFDECAVAEEEAPSGGSSIRVSERGLAASVEGRLGEDASAAGGLVSLAIDVERLFVAGRWTSVRGGVLLSVGGTPDGDRVGQWRRGRRIRAPALLRLAGRYRDVGVPDHRVQLMRRGTTLVGSIKSALLVEQVAPASRIGEASGLARAWIRRVLDRHVGVWSRRAAGIVTAILVGDRAGLEPDDERRLQAAGTYHVIAISGGNIAILAGLLLVLLTVTGFGPRTTGVAAIAVLVAYAHLVGGGASVVRATIMAVTYLVARLLDHRSPPGNAIAASGAIVVAASPLSLTDVGLALTFGATLGIVAGASLTSGRLPNHPVVRWLAVMLVASLSAELALFPVTARVFSRVTAAGLILNFLAVPAMTLVQVAGMAVIALTGVPALASAAGAVACGAAWVIVESARLVELAPWLSPRVPPPSWAGVATYYLGWVMALVASSMPAVPPGRRLRWSVPGWLVACASGAWIVVAPAFGSGGDGLLRVTWLDVGHADATLVRFPDGTSLLVDAAGALGPSSFDIGGRVVSPALWATGLRRLDLFAITHGDPDHIGGARAVIEDFRPREVWDGIEVSGSVPMAQVRQASQRAGARWRRRTAGEREVIGGVEVLVWHPPPPDWERRKVRNDDSLVIELRWRRLSVLLTGDIGAAVERQLAPHLEPAPLVVMKVPHHGSAGSSDPALLRAVRPGVAVLTTGRGSWIGRDIQRRYAAEGAAWFRTDEDGAVTMTSDGESLEVTTFTGRRLTVEGRRSRRPT